MTNGRIHVCHQIRAGRAASSGAAGRRSNCRGTARQALHRQCGRCRHNQDRPAAGQDRRHRRADRISGEWHLPGAGGTRQQDHGPAGGAGLAGRTLAARLAAEHAEAGAGEQGCRDPRRLAQLQRPGRAGHRGATEDPVRLQQRRRHRHERQELQSLHVPAEHAGGGAGSDVRAVHHGLRQEVVFPHGELRVRPGHREIVQARSSRRPAAPSPATMSCR